MLKLITLDLDNTLWDVDRIIINAEAQMRAWMAEHVPYSLSHYQPDTLNTLRAKVVEKHPHKVHDLSFMRQQVLYEVMKLAGCSELQAQRNAEAAFEVFYVGRNTIEFFPGALDMLAELSREYTLYALTNGNANIELAGISDYFAGALSSADVGCKKPDAAIFQAALQQFALQPQQAVHVGDNLLDDIHGANNVGMRSVWVNLTGHQRGQQDAVPDAEVTHLNHVSGAIRQLNP